MHGHSKKPTSPPASVVKLPAPKLKAEQFGKQRLADFLSDPSYVNVNHGSYGYVPRSVLAAKH